MYCCNCYRHGHSYKCCPDVVGKAIREGKPHQHLKNKEMIVPDSDFGVRSVLRLYKVPLASTQDGNRRLLYDLAYSMKPPHVVTFILAPKKNEVHSESVSGENK